MDQWAAGARPAFDLSELLGRPEIVVDTTAAGRLLRDRRVLVTGAGGSIGAELCRQVHSLRPAELVLLDRDESGLHATQLALHGRALLDSDEVVLADIRDEATIVDVFERRRPQVVLHAAALKHLPLLERHPAEALKTNVRGTATVLAAAAAVGVTHFVNVSTDKASDPSSVLGCSKRLAEGLTADLAGRATGTYLSVRFGNVLGSRGSVLGAFLAQIAAGGPVTVTHPDATRYLVTVVEACRLVLQAAATGRDAETLVLDMGRPVVIRELAERLLAQAGSDAVIEYTGLRPGEKLHEQRLGSSERDHRPFHRLVTHVGVPPLPAWQVEALESVSDPDELRTRMVELCAAMSATSAAELEAAP